MPGDMSSQAEILLELLSAASTMLVLTGGITDDDKRRVFEQRRQLFCQISIVNQNTLNSGTVFQSFFEPAKHQLDYHLLNEPITVQLDR